MPRNPPKRAIPASKSKAKTPRVVNIPGVGKARTMELRRSDIIAMRKFDKAFRKNPEKYLKDFKPLGTAKPRKFPNTRHWFEGFRDYVDSAANTLMELDMRGELADPPPGSKEKGVIRIANRWDQGPKKRRKPRKRPKF